MGKLNAERFLSCDYVISSLQIWGACAFGCPTLDTRSLICMSINAPRTPTEIKNTTQCLCKNRLLASKSRGTCIFPESGSAPLISGGLWAKKQISASAAPDRIQPIFYLYKNPTKPLLQLWRENLFYYPLSLFLGFFLITLIWAISSRAWSY